MKSTKKAITLGVLCSLLIGGGIAYAAVTAREAEQLKGDADTPRRGEGGQQGRDNP